MTDFEVYIDLGSDVSVRFTMSEEEVRADPHPSVRATAIAADKGDDPVERRTAARAAAYERVNRMVTRNVTEPISVVDGATVWIIPTHAIRAVRLRDPDVSEERRPFGFVKRPDE
jgi:hypothetical protein